MKEKTEHKKLIELVNFLAEQSPFYKQVFASTGVDPKEIRSVEDLQRLPFTTKEDLQQRGRDFVCVTPEKLIDHVCTSGTSGKPVTLSLTEADLERLALNECNSFRIAGIQASDTLQMMTTIDRRFMAGLAYFLGARKLGAGIIRVGAGLPELQLDTILEMKPSVLICVPSFLLKLSEYARSAKIDLAKTSVKKAICIGEPIRQNDLSLNALGKKIQEQWPIELFSTYASTEISTAFTECEYHAGGHHQEDLIIVELVDEAGKPVKPGEVGELVVTPLGVEGMPLLRFKTGDVCRLHNEPCKCGRPGLRLGPILGRKNQMIKYKGTTLFPAAVFDILENTRGVNNYQMVVDSGEVDTDEITLYIGLEEKETITETEITDLFKAKLRVTPRLQFLPSAEIQKLLFPENSRKAQKFIDKRKKYIHV